MAEATKAIIEIWQAFINFVFEETEIEPGVTIGWILLGVSLTGAIIATLAPRVIAPRPIENGVVVATDEKGRFITK